MGAAMFAAMGTVASAGASDISSEPCSAGASAGAAGGDHTGAAEAGCGSDHPVGGGGSPAARDDGRATAPLAGLPWISPDAALIPTELRGCSMARAVRLPSGSRARSPRGCWGWLWPGPATGGCR